jgi:hexosaminidase
LYEHALDFPASGAVTLRAAAFAPDGFSFSAPRTQIVNASALRSRNGNALQPCSDQAETMRVSGNHPLRNARSAYKANVGDMCWRWPRAPLDDVKRVTLSIDRVAWQFEDDAPHAITRPKTTPAGEIEVHLDTCMGPVIATVPLAAAASAREPTELTADVALPPNAGVRDVCVIATGDPREGQWTLAHIEFLQGNARSTGVVATRMSSAVPAHSQSDRHSR